MSKKHKHHQRPAASAWPPHTKSAIMANPRAHLARIEALLAEERLEEALPLLEALAAHEGRRAPAVWQMLALAYHDLERWEQFEESAQRLADLVPNEPAAQLTLAEAHLNRDHSMHTIQVLRRFLARWPTHPEAAQARQLLSAVEPELAARLAQCGLTLETGAEAAIQHERAMAALDRHQYVEARHLEEQVLRLAPTFLPALNTISLIYYLEDRPAQAISAARRVLERDGANVHALSNLIRFLVVTGHRDDAAALAPRLLAAASPAEEAWVKKAEALSYLGNDASLLELLGQVERTGKATSVADHPLGLHLAAVAAWRLGHPQKARALWRRALALDPTFELAQANLDDLAKPASERHAPWPYTLNYWISERTMQSLRTQMSEYAAHMDELPNPDNEERLLRTLRSLLAGHSEIAALIPVLLDRGDPIGRGFALTTARAADTPELRLALRDFAESQRGPDDARMQAARAVSESGLFPGRKARLWLKGQWTELLLYAYAITGEPSYTYPPAVEALMLQAMNALHEKRYADAEQHLRQALVLHPNAPELQNNLALAIGKQGRDDEANAMADVIFAEHPDYLFGRLSRAQKLIQRGELAQARVLIDPVLERTHLHFSELRMICRTQMAYFLAEQNAEAADTWLSMWQDAEMDPQAAEEEMMYWQMRIGFTRLMSRRRGPRKASGGKSATKTKQTKQTKQKAGTKPEATTTPGATPKPHPTTPAPRLLSADLGDTAPQP